MVTLWAPNRMLALTLHDSLWAGLQGATGITGPLDKIDAEILSDWANGTCDNPHGQRAALARSIAMLLDVTGTLVVDATAHQATTFFWDLAE